MTPTARSLVFLRKHAWQAGVVEQWVPKINIRRDFLGCIDIIAVMPGRCLGIQATSGSNASARLNKALPLLGLRAWLESNGLFEVWAWRKTGERGKRKLWTLRRLPICLKGADRTPYMEGTDTEVAIAL